MRRVWPQKCCLEWGQEASWVLGQLKARTPALAQGQGAGEVQWAGRSCRQDPHTTLQSLEAAQESVKLEEEPGLQGGSPNVLRGAQGAVA